MAELGAEIETLKESIAIASSQKSDPDVEIEPLKQSVAIAELQSFDVEIGPPKENTAVAELQKSVCCGG